MDYGFVRTISLPFEHVLERITEELKKEGFGVLTSIDIQDTLKKKLNVDFKRYVILGACNPYLAHTALQAEDNVGLLLPCNVIVYEKEHHTVLAAFDPMSMTKLIDNPAIHPVAAEANIRLRRALEAV